MQGEAEESHTLYKLIVFPILVSSFPGRGWLFSVLTQIFHHLFLAYKEGFSMLVSRLTRYEMEKKPVPPPVWRSFSDFAKAINKKLFRKKRVIELFFPDDFIRKGNMGRNRMFVQPQKRATHYVYILFMLVETKLATPYTCNEFICMCAKSRCWISH